MLNGSCKLARGLRAIPQGGLLVVGFLGIVCSLHQPIHGQSVDEPSDSSRGDSMLEDSNDFFRLRVAPIFEQHCIRCHSAADSSGELDLTHAVGVMRDGIVNLAQPAESRLLVVITSDDQGKAEMPQDAPPLSAEERQVLAEWIEAGAVWPAEFEIAAGAVANFDWWSLKPIDSVNLATHRLTPTAKLQEHPIDERLAVQHEQLGLQPVPLAPPDVLLRRLSYDLAGLPPTPDEIDAFVTAYQQTPELTWETTVDRLLASPTFGEKWGQHWLDLARYAETHGYDKDKPRPNAWPYRDYVIESFNCDKPIDRFAQEQIAGDVVCAGEPEGIAALGFLAAGPWDFIGHVEVGEGKLDGRIAKHLDRDEMLSTVFNVFMSTTIQCAQCHHHKFDPLRMEDYYRAQAVFAAVDRANRVYRGLSPEQQLDMQELKEERGQVADKLSGLQERLMAELQSKLGDSLPRREELLRSHPIAPAEAYGYHSHIESTQDVAKWVQVDLNRTTVLSRIRLVPAYDLYAGIGSGFGFPTRFQVLVSDGEDFAGDVRLVYDAAYEDLQNPESQVFEVDCEGVAARYVRVVSSKLRERERDYIFALSELEVLDAAGSNVALGASVSALDSIEALPRWGKQNLTDGIYWQRSYPVDALEELVDLEGQRRAARRTVYTGEVQHEFDELQQQLGKLDRELSRFPAGDLVYAAATEFVAEGQFKPSMGRPREIKLLLRGDLKSPAERMSPGLPALWPKAAEKFFTLGEASDLQVDAGLPAEAKVRSELARYLTHSDNPLFWRSMANRIWQWTFGQPLVGTPNDFGRMGRQPASPELLEMLAARLRDDPGHSLKSLVRWLVTSRAYRRAVVDNAVNESIDEENQFYWRGNRRKLTAEEFRDSLLRVAGVLSDQRGGPSFRDFVVEKPEHSPHYQYHLADPNDPATFRRTIYRFVVRSQPQPMLTVLDCADPSISVPLRDESTTALQALTQWNDRLVDAMSVQFATRLRSEAMERQQTVNELVEYACRLALGRRPSAEEQGLLVSLLNEHGEAVLARVLFNMSAFNYVE